jgi:hypothetical protein
LERTTGIEPATSTLATLRATSCATSAWSLLAGLNRRPSSYQGDALPTELNRRGWPPKTRTWTFLLQRQAGCRLPHRPSRAVPRCRPGSSALQGRSHSRVRRLRSFVRSAGVEPATSRLSTWPLCQLEYEHVKPLPGADPGHPRYEGGVATVRSGLAGIPGFEPGCSGIRARRVCQFPHIPKVRAAGVDLELGAAACYATPACAARESNPVSPD